MAASAPPAASARRCSSVRTPPLAISGRSVSLRNRPYRPRSGPSIVPSTWIDVTRYLGVPAPSRWGTNSSIAGPSDDGYVASGVEMPVVGSTWNQTPNANSSSIPVQNVGILHVTSEEITIEESALEPRREAAQTPNTIPRAATMMVAAVNSTKVLTSRAPTICATGCRYVYEKPRSPCTNPFR